MNRNVFEALNATPDGGAPKNPFDLHNYEWMTSKAGQFLPVGCREVVPDGTYDLSVDAYTMTFPCNTASQADMKENYYFLFVPYYLLTRTAYSFFPQRKDNHSALDYQFEQMPWFPLGDVVSYCVLEAAKFAKGYRGSDVIKDVHGYCNALSALRLLDLLGYGSYLDCVQKAVELYGHSAGFPVPEVVTNFCNKLKTSLNTYKPNALRIAAYQKIWYCYFRNSVYDNDISPKCFNFDDVTYPSDTTYNILDYRTVSDFVNTCLQMRYVENKKDVITASMPGTQFGAVSSIPLSLDLSGTTSQIPLSGYTTGDYPNAYPTQVHKGNPNANLGYLKALKGEGDDIRGQVEIEEGFSAAYDTRVKVITPHTHPAATVSISSSGSSLFDVLQLTEAQAIQKWRQKSMLAGQKAKDQWRAHYGVVPQHMSDDYPDFIGSVDNPIQISQVISNANTMADDDKSNLGDIAGRGYGASSNKVFRFHAKEYGIIMLCRSVVAENVYASFGLDRANQLIYYSDFWQPEFQNIGLEAVPKSIIQSFEPSGQVDPTGEGGSEPLPSNSSVIGYAPRNYQLKSYRSKVHGLFNPNRFNEGFATGANPNVPYGFGQLEAFVQLRRDVIQSLGYVSDTNTFTIGGIPITRSTLYVNPVVTNSTFGFDVDSFEDTDVFIHKHRFNCDAVQPLTTLGLPQF